MCLTVKQATLLWPFSFYGFDLIPILPPCPDGFEKTEMTFEPEN